jgi:hypothetical protein
MVGRVHMSRTGLFGAKSAQVARDNHLSDHLIWFSVELVRPLQKKFPFIILWGFLCRGLAAEMPDIGSQVGGAGFAAPPPGLVTGGLSSGDGDEMLELFRGLSLGFGTSLFYDSNVGQSPDTRDFPAQDDFILMLSPSLRWARASSTWNFGLGARGSFGEHFENSDYSSKNYGLDGSIGYRAGRLKLGGSASYAFNEGVNRFYRGVVAESTYGVGLSAAYEMSPKTSLEASFGSSWRQPEGRLGETESQNGNLSAMWRYSSLLRIGPGLSYSRATGEFQLPRTSWGPTLSADYKLSKKVSVNGRVGFDFVDYDGGSSDHAFSTAINASYALSPLTRMSLGLSRGVQADGSVAGAFRESTALRFSVDQKIGRVRAGLGLGYEYSSYSSGSGRSPRSPLDFYTGDLSLSMPFWGDRAAASVFLRYSDSVSDELFQDWSGIQTGVSVNFQF